MRRCDEAIEVRTGRVDEVEGPSLFLWRNKVWRVLDVHSRWIESSPWWESPGARAARGDVELGDVELGDVELGDVELGDAGAWSASSGGVAEPVGDLLGEREVWRVEAANGREASRGIYELDHSWGDGSWRLRAVLD
ncbi:DUF6504 family protein [Luteococcus sp. Sow4_B9]|uniref:DUF6504 family protein n=1 Tax=Luteococcus sp. Sow4_B9 TaxID=3438792 RepID=UPI003F9ACFDC